MAAARLDGSPSKTRKMSDPRRPVDDVPTAPGSGAAVDDTKSIIGLNNQFIEAFRHGSWDLLAPILSPSFVYLDGNTGDVTDRDTYAKTWTAIRFPSSSSTRSWCMSTVTRRSCPPVRRSSPVVTSRYVDSYERRDSRWTCSHAYVWRLQS
jgi:hypothetical protein